MWHSGARKRGRRWQGCPGRGDFGSLEPEAQLPACRVRRPSFLTLRARARIRACRRFLICVILSSAVLAAQDSDAKQLSSASEGSGLSAGGVLWFFAIFHILGAVQALVTTFDSMERFGAQLYLKEDYESTKFGKGIQRMNAAAGFGLAAVFLWAAMNHGKDVIDQGEGFPLPVAMIVGFVAMTIFGIVEFVIYGVGCKSSCRPRRTLWRRPPSSRAPVVLLWSIPSHGVRRGCGVPMSLPAHALHIAFSARNGLLCRCAPRLTRLLCRPSSARPHVSACPTPSVQTMKNSRSCRWAS